MVPFLENGAARAPLRGLSCPYSALQRPNEGLRVHRRVRSFGPHARGAGNRYSTTAADRWQGYDSLTAGDRNPPTSGTRHARPWIWAVSVAFIVAAVLAQAGW
jgi:hypothetical protein